MGNTVYGRQCPAPTRAFTQDNTSFQPAPTPPDPLTIRTARKLPLGTTGTNPWGIMIDSSGNIYTANYGANNVSKITPAGVSSILGTTGTQPYAITIDSAGNIYTANGGSSNVSKITPAGVSSILATTGINPYGIAIDSAGNIYTANYGVNNVSKITPGGVTSILDTTGANPWGIMIDSSGNIYTANYGANNVSKISAGGGTASIFAAPPAVPLSPSVVAGGEFATVTVSANAVSAIFGVPSSYTVTAVEDASKSCLVTVPATACQVTGLTAGTSYSFTSRANLNIWQTAASVASNSVTPTLVPPSAPLVPTVVAGDGSVVVTVAAGPGNAPASYTVTASPGGGTCTVTGSAGSCTVSGLTNGTAYTFTATATNAGGMSSSSAASNSVTPSVTPTGVVVTPLNTFTMKLLKSSAAGFITTQLNLPGLGIVVQVGTIKLSKSRVTVMGKKAKIRTMVVCKARMTVTKAGKLTIKCLLTKKGRTARKKHALKVSLVTTFTPTGGTAFSIRKTLKVKKTRVVVKKTRLVVAASHRR